MSNSKNLQRPSSGWYTGYLRTSPRGRPPMHLLPEWEIENRNSTPLCGAAGCLTSLKPEAAQAAVGQPAKLTELIRCPVATQLPAAESRWEETISRE
jgi:hypothetical protein